MDLVKGRIVATRLGVKTATFFKTQRNVESRILAKFRAGKGLDFFSDWSFTCIYWTRALTFPVLLQYETMVH